MPHNRHDHLDRGRRHERHEGRRHQASNDYSRAYRTQPLETEEAAMRLYHHASFTTNHGSGSASAAHRSITPRRSVHRAQTTAHIGASNVDARRHDLNGHPAVYAPPPNTSSTAPRSGFGEYLRADYPPSSSRYLSVPSTERYHGHQGRSVSTDGLLDLSSYRSPAPAPSRPLALHGLLGHAQKPRPSARPPESTSLALKVPRTLALPSQ